MFSGYVPSTLIQQADGSSVRVFNYSSLTINSGVSLTLFGSLPAVLASTGDITINGAVVIQTNRLAAGADTQSAPGATGGKVGSGSGAYVGYPCCGYDVGSGGGGGGKGSAGAQGNAGSLFPGGAPNGVGGLGGSKDPTPLILSGGGGGGGVYGTNHFNYAAGAGGGLGGGAALFVTPDNITIGATGSVLANGGRGADANYAPGGNAGTGGGGGGGAGGAIWFDAGGAWTNSGTISVQGGGPGYPVGSTPRQPRKQHRRGRGRRNGRRRSGGDLQLRPDQPVRRRRRRDQRRHAGSFRSGDRQHLHGHRRGGARSRARRLGVAHRRLRPGRPGPAAAAAGDRLRARTKPRDIYSRASKFTQGQFT